MSENQLQEIIEFVRQKIVIAEKAEFAFMVKREEARLILTTLEAAQTELCDFRELRDEWALGDSKKELICDRNMYKTQLVEARAEIELRKEFIEARKDRASAYHSFWFSRRLEGKK